MRNMAKSTIILILTALLCVVGIANDANSAYNPIPTGTGWRHVTGGFEDPAARAVNLASSDVTGSLPLSSSTSPTGTGLAKVSAGSWVSAASLLVDADVSATAAIQGTKITPNFASAIIGAATANSPYGVHGLASVALPTGATATTVITALQYANYTIETTAALTANQVITLPGATDAASYTKLINNICTGSFSVIVGASTGAATVTVANGTTVTVLVDSRGVTLVSGGSVVPAGTGYYHITTPGTLDAAAAALTFIGDVTGTGSGTSISLTAGKVNGSTVPAGGALTTGNVLQVTGVSALGYAPVNLAGGANFVVNLLPLINEAAPTGTGVAHVSSGSWAAAASLVSLTTDVANVLPLANGGTNASTGLTTANGVVTSSGTALQQATDVLAGSGFISIGGALNDPGHVGAIRLEFAASGATPAQIVGRYNGTTDYPLFSFTNAAFINIGADNSGNGAYPGQISLNSTSVGNVQVVLGGSVVPFAATATAVSIGNMPIIGSAGQSSPYSVHGLATGIALPTTAAATTIITSAQYKYNTLQFTGALTANQTVTLPGEADVGAYTKIIDNLCTNSFAVIVGASTGAGTVTIPNGTRATVLVDSRGVTMPIEAATGIAIGSAPSSTGNIRGSSDLFITHNVGGVDRNVLDATSGADIILGDPTNGGSIINRAPAAGLFYFQVGGNNLAEIDQNGVHVGVGGTDALTFGTSGYAASGLIRLPNNTNVIAFRNSGGTADMVAMATDTATLYLGYDNTGANAFTNTTVAASNGVQMVSGGHAVADFDTSVVDVGNATYTTQTSIRSSSNIYTQSATFTCQDAAATATRFKVDANNIYGSLPYIGTANDPHGVHGKTTVATGGTFTVGASDYIMDAVMFSYSSGVLAAFPAPANDGAAYYKTIINTGNATDYVHDTLPVGSVRNCTIPASSTMRVLFDLAGCHPVSASVSYP